MNRTMNRTIFRCSLDIHDIYSQFTLPIKKGDTSGRLVITLMENGKPYQIIDGCYAIFAGVKANGAILHNACIVEKNTIIYDISKGTTSTAGKIGGEIILYDEEGQELISPRFTIVVHDSIYSEAEVEESGEFLSLINVLSEAKSLIANVESKLKNGAFKGDRGEKGDKGEKGDTGSYAFDGIYNAETNKAATVQTVTDKIAEIVANAPEKLNTLEEISAWIEEHPKDVAEMNALISKNTNAISNFENGTVAVKKANELALGETLVFESDSAKKVSCNLQAGVYLVVTEGYGSGNSAGNTFFYSGIIVIGTLHGSGISYKSTFGDYTGYMTYYARETYSYLQFSGVSEVSKVYITKIANYFVPEVTE